MIYTIPKGNHYPKGLRFFPFLKAPKQEYIVLFDETCVYDIGPDQSDWNKAFGQTHGLANNSSRWGWRWNPTHQCIQIMPYMHERGKIRRADVVLDVPLNRIIGLGIEAKGNRIIFSYDAEEVYSWQPPTRCRIGYKCFPYFGGNCPAPHDVNILLDKVG